MLWPHSAAHPSTQSSRHCMCTSRQGRATGRAAEKASWSPHQTGLRPSNRCSVCGLSRCVCLRPMQTKAAGGRTRAARSEHRAIPIKPSPQLEVDCKRAAALADDKVGSSKGKIPEQEKCKPCTGQGSSR